MSEETKFLKTIMRRILYLEGQMAKNRKGVNFDMAERQALFWIVRMAGLEGFLDELFAAEEEKRESCGD